MTIKELFQQNLNEGITAKLLHPLKVEEVYDFITNILDNWKTKKIIKDYKLHKYLGYIILSLNGLDKTAKISINSETVKKYAKDDSFQATPVNVKTFDRWFKRSYKNMYVGLINILNSIPQIYKKHDVDYTKFFSRDDLESVIQKTIERFKEQNVIRGGEIAVKIVE